MRISSSSFKWLLLVFALVFHTQVRADDARFDQSLLLFPIIHTEIRPNVESEQNLDPLEVEYGSDILYSLHYDRYRVLTEFYASVNEFELERLLFAVETAPRQTLSLGRFHAPLGYWNTQFHHGVHLQSSVHRPGIIEYEDAGGVLSNHMSGAMLEGVIPQGEGVFQYALSMGSAPMLYKGTLHPWTTSSYPADHGMQIGLRLSFQPSEIDANQYGVFANSSDIEAKEGQLNGVKQRLLGAYVHQDWQPFSLTSALFYVHNRLEESTGNKSSSFSAAYLHGEYEISSDWLVYGRLERLLGSEENAYLEYFNDPNLDRNLAGIRWDFTRRQAISVEASMRVNEHESHTHISLQWSAMFP